MKLLYAILTILLATIFVPAPAYANDETAKALIGSVIGIMAAEAMKEPTTSQETKEDIQWNEPRHEPEKEIPTLTERITEQQDQAVTEETPRSVTTNPNETSKEPVGTIATSSHEDKKGMPKLLKIIIWFSVFFGFLVLIALIKGIIEHGSEFGLRLILSPQFFIIVLGLPFAYFAGIASISDGAEGVSGSDLLLLLFALSIPIIIAYVMNARASSYAFAIPYTLIQLLSIPFCIFVFAVFKGARDELGSKRKYR